MVQILKEVHCLYIEVLCLGQRDHLKTGGQKHGLKTKNKNAISKKKKRTVDVDKTLVSHMAKKN